MGKQIYNISYSGLDAEYRIDCLAQIRRMQNPPGSTCVDVDGLSKSCRSTSEDAKANKTPWNPGEFVKLGKIEY